MPKLLSTDEIRKRWVEFFVARGHKHIASDSLVPQNDPSVLFTGAGMNQFKDNFMGRAKIDNPQQRAVTVQKCMRAGDIENVGRTPSHHTFFEMLGNFSFGDYFKKEAIEWAWTFTTNPDIGIGLEKERLSVTIFGGDAKLGIEKDAEAEKWWKTFAPELQNKDGSWRIYEYGEHDNFWPADAPSNGPNGPCGPCSEIYYDTKPEQGAPEPVANSKDPIRYIEIGNKVFTQFNRVGVGKLDPLSQKNIDVGDGLERLTRVVQGKANNYEIDLLFPIVQEVARISGKTYGKNFEDDRRMRRITDHARSAVFCIADGVTPGNKGREYVVRRMIRTAASDGVGLGISELFLGRVAKTAINQMGVGYPDLLPRTEIVIRIIEEEERAFGKTRMQGRQHFEEAVSEAKDLKAKEISGANAFRLWDTFGIPIELTTEMANSLGMTVDQTGFLVALQKAQKRSHEGSAMSKEIFFGGPVAALKKQYAGQPTVFEGYDKLTVERANVLEVLAVYDVDDANLGGAGTSSVNVRELQSVPENIHRSIVLLDKTPFYAESGGQVGDKGVLLIDGKRYSVSNTQKQEGLVLHEVEGVPKPDTTVTAEVDPSHRSPTIKNHSATHLLHHALRKTLGTHVEQRGSLVAPDRLRFDFTHFEQIKPEQLQKIEDDVNALVTENVGVSTEVLPIAEAKAKGAMALFGEKYGERVRVVTMGPSIELCGGTHCKSTGQIGYFRIVSESSVAAGVRRIEALTGLGAVADARRNDALLNTLALQLKTKKETVIERFTALQEEKAALERELEGLRKKAANAAAGELLSGVKDVGGTKLLAANVEGADAAALRTTLDGIRKNLKDGAVVLGGAKDGKVALIVSLSPDVVARGGHAGNLLKELAPKVGGKGGGKPDMAQGGGTDVAKLGEALAAAEALLKAMLK